MKSYNNHINALSLEGRGAVLLLFSVLVFGMISCRRDTPLPGPQPDMEQPIYGSAGVGGVVTKGYPVLTSERLKSTGFGAMAYWRNKGEYFDGIDLGHEYLNNAHFNYSETVSGDNLWRLTPTAYWPAGCTLTFFFWAPWMPSDGGMLTFPLSRSEGGLPRGRFTQDSDPAQQVDFCLALPAYDRSGTQGPVPAVFNHALTEVRFAFNITGELYEGDDYVYRVDRLIIEGVAGTNEFAIGGTGNGYKWDPVPHDDTSVHNASYTLSVDNGTLVAAVSPFEWDVEGETGLDKFLWVNSPQDGHLYLLPQYLNSQAQIRLLVSAYHYDGVDWEYLFTLDEKTVKLPEATPWEGGRVIVYTGSIDVSRWIDLELGVTLLPWGTNQEDAGVFNADELATE